MQAWAPVKAGAPFVGIVSISPGQFLKYISGIGRLFTSTDRCKPPPRPFITDQASRFETCVIDLNSFPCYNRTSKYLVIEFYFTEGEMYMDIGNKIKMLRQKIGATQEQLGEKIGVSAQSISKWETGISHS